MARAKTSSFVTTVELQVTPEQAVILRKRFNAARMVYNACLSHYLKHATRLRQCRDYRRYKGMKSAGKKKDANALFKEMVERFQLREFSTNYLIDSNGLNWLAKHIGTKEAAATRQQSYKAFHNWMLSGFKNQRPKFRRFDQLDSVQSRTKGGIRWREGENVVEWKRSTGKLTLHAHVNQNDAVLMHGINSPIKFTRLTRKVIRGQERFYAQLVNEGNPYKKPSHKPKRGVVGLDIGTQTIAAVSENDAFLDTFCNELVRDENKVRRIQRSLDRSRRATNPHCFDEKGRWIKGQKFTPSKSYLKKKQELTELKRKQADHRKNLHGQMVARVLKLGDDIRVEDLNFRSFAKKAKLDKDNPTKRRARFGKSIGFRSPGTFIARLDAEASKWGADLDQFDPRTHALSQTCFCGSKKKKHLGERVHKCSECGASAQRDLFSAYMCRYVEGKTLHADQASKDWSGFCNTLASAWDKVKADTTAPSSLGLRLRRKSGVSSSGKALAEERATASATVSGPQREPEKNDNARVLTTDSDQFLRENSTVNPVNKPTSDGPVKDSG